VKKKESFVSSYPTYEEWKHNVSGITPVGYDGSYPTYEEWKHGSANATIAVTVKFLSYL